jgi:hypothetical protein
MTDNHRRCTACVGPSLTGYQDHLECERTTAFSLTIHLTLDRFTNRRPPASGGMRHRLQMSETPRNAKADRYGHRGRHAWHEWEIVPQFEQISNC